MFNSRINWRQTSFSVATTFEALYEDIVGAMDKRGREGFGVVNCWRDCVDWNVSDRNEHEKPGETQVKSSNAWWSIWSCWIVGGNDAIFDQVDER